MRQRDALEVAACSARGEIRLAAAWTVDIGFAVEQPNEGAGRFTHSELSLSRGFDVNRDSSLSRVAFLLRVPSSQLPRKAFALCAPATGHQPCFTVQGLLRRAENGATHETPAQAG